MNLSAKRTNLAKDVDSTMGVDLPQDRSGNEPYPLLALAVQYHSSGRSEIARRVGYRDTTLFLFLTASATLFSLSLNANYQSVLYVIPFLGLGASQVYSQHSLVIGALGRYLGYELNSWVRRIHGDQDIPPQWNSSESLLEMRGGGHLRPTLVSGLVLIVLPQILSLTVLLINVRPSVGNVFGLLIGGLASGLSLLFIAASHIQRKKYAQEMKSYVSEWRRQASSSDGV